MSNRQRNCLETSSYKPNTWNGNRRGGKRRRRPTESHERPEEQHLTPSYQHRSNNRGRQRRGHRQGGRPESSTQMPSQTVPEIPGMYFDQVRGKYFAIASDQSGISGYNKSDLEAKQKQQNLMVDVEKHREAVRKRTGTKSLTSLQSRIQRGCLSAEQMERKMAESRLTSIQDSPHSVHDIVNTFTYDDLTGCKFLSVSQDGTSLFGCWGANGVAFSNCLNVSVDKTLRNEAYHRLERDDSSLQNTMGLLFDQSANSVGIAEPEIVDMCIAPIDSEVTGCLYVTASTMFKRNQLRSRCNVLLHPLAEWSNPENDVTLDSPIYNIDWTASDHIWSCGWSPNKMYISLGLEDSARICDIVTEKKFLISTRGKQVVCQKFSADGNIIIMCPRGRNVMCSDLRMYSKHCIDNDETDWPDTKKCCFAQPLQSQYRDHVLTQAFDGHLKLWDLRQKTRPILEYGGHKNEGYKLSCIVDSEERFVFAVGSDGCTRGWSISSGELLCELPPPQALTTNSEFPRIAYSESWGGQVGNTALVVATGSSINVHQLGL